MMPYIIILKVRNFRQPTANRFGLYGYMENKMYRISSFKHRCIYFIMALLCAAFISRIEVEENEIMCHFKGIS